MPNHVLNVLTIEGAKEDIVKVLKKIKGTKKSACPYIDFNKIEPLPKELRKTKSGIESRLAKEIISDALKRSGVKLKDMNERMMADAKDKLLDEHLKQVTLDFIDKINNIDLKIFFLCFIKYGYVDWYDWSYAKWGTKWNAYQQELVKEKAVSFQTAWSTPEPIIKTLSKKFPEVLFHIAYADEDLGSNCGEYTYEKGELTYQKDHDKEGALGHKFACDLWNYTPDEEE